MNHYLKKQFIIGFVWLIIFVVIIGGVYFLVIRGGESDTDNNQNQGEEKEEIEILASAIIPTTENNYDLLVVAKNPNSKWGAKLFHCAVDFYDVDNQLIASREEKTYILPQETKYIVMPRIFLGKTPVSADFKIKEVSFVKLENFKELELKIKNRELQITADGLHKIVGAIENRTSYDLDTIEVVGLLLDQEGNVIAMGKTEMNTVLMNESRGFEITWPYEISEQVSNFDIHIYTDVFSNENFLKSQ